MNCLANFELGKTLQLKLEVDAGLERHDLLQLLKDVAVWESMPMHELKLEIAKSTGPAVCDRGCHDCPRFC